LVIVDEPADEPETAVDGLEPDAGTDGPDDEPIDPGCWVL
jgi:hypothetical protein